MYSLRLSRSQKLVSEKCAALGVGLGEKTLTFGKTLSNLEMLNTLSKAALLVEAELASQD